MIGESAAVLGSTGIRSEEMAKIAVPTKGRTGIGRSSGAFNNIQVDATDVSENDPPHIASISYQLVLTTEEGKENIGRLVDYLHARGTVYNTVIPTLSVTEKSMLQQQDSRVGLSK